MDNTLISLMAASLALVGTHFALSHPMRAPLVGMVGEKGFLGLYSLVAIACLYWMSTAFKAAPPVDLPGSGAIGWLFATLVTLPALVLFLGSLRGNPALPDPTGAAKMPANARGVFTVTRHPMMWGFALWALSHIVLWWNIRTLIVAGAILLLALLGSHLQDRKKERLMGDSWTAWEAQTSYWPRWGNLLRAGRTLWLVAIAAWLLVTYAHVPVGGIPAGLWMFLL